jgi:phage head maturation protease
MIVVNNIMMIYDILYNVQHIPAYQRATDEVRRTKKVNKKRTNKKKEMKARHDIEAILMKENRKK